MRILEMFEIFLRYGYIKTRNFPDFARMAVADGIVDPFLVELAACRFCGDESTLEALFNDIWVRAGCVYVQEENVPSFVSCTICGMDELLAEGAKFLCDFSDSKFAAPWGDDWRQLGESLFVPVHAYYAFIEERDEGWDVTDSDLQSELSKVRKVICDFCGRSSMGESS